MASSLPPVAQRAVDHLQATLNTVLESVASLQRSDRWYALQRSIDTLGRGLGLSPTGEQPAVLHPGDVSKLLAEAVHAIILDESKLERASADEAVFRLEARELSSLSGAERSAAELFNALKATAHVRADAIALHAGNGAPLFSVVTGANRLDLVVDLSVAAGAAHEVRRLVAKFTGEALAEWDDDTNITEFGGVLSLGMIAPSKNQVQISVEIRKELRLAGELGGRPWKLSVAPSQALLVEHDGKLGTVAVKLHLGALHFDGPLLDEDEQGSDLIELAANALTAELALKPGEKSVTFQNIGFGGPLKLKPHAGPAGSLDVNRMSIGLVPSKSGGADFKLAAPLTMSLAWLGQSYKIEAPADATIRFLGDDDEGDGILEVVAGQLDVNAVGASKPLRLKKGSVLTILDEDEARRDEKHPVLRLFAARG